jgi:hypothetical protein
VRELEGDIGQAVADVRDALHREVAALAQAEDERAVSAFCFVGFRLHQDGSRVWAAPGGGRPGPGGGRARGGCCSGFRFQAAPGGGRPAPGRA